MIDIHTHIIPNVDDGSSSLDVSIELLKEEIKYGIRDVFLTPHQNKMNLNKSLIIEKFEKLKNDVANLNINLFLGSEIYYYESLSEDIKNGKIISMNNTKYILIEFSVRGEDDIIDKLYDLIVIGYIPIIAHIERYPYLSFSDIKKIHDMGVKIQVNTKSFNDKEYKKLIKFLLKNNYIDFIGTDCHDLDKRNVEYNLDKVFKKYPNLLKRIEENEKYLV